MNISSPPIRHFIPARGELARRRKTSSNVGIPITESDILSQRNTVSQLDPNDFKLQLESYQQQAERALQDHLPAASTHPSRLHESMRYSIEAGGKRLRPVLVLATHAINGGAVDAAPAAAAVEALHTYSLIHDDLPCMDDSDLRRGKATCHKVYDEATALLAGDALLTEAFALLGTSYLKHPEIGIRLVAELGQAAGSQKLIGGQMEDLLGENAPPSADRLHYIHSSKTAALITACISMGLILSDITDEAVLQAGRELGTHMGIAFQIMDDILDVTSDTASMGKTTGLDERNQTLTYPSLYGLEASHKAAQDHTDKALEAARTLEGGEGFLFLLTTYLLTRKN